MKTFFNIIHIFLSVVLIILISLQSKGGGLRVPLSSLKEAFSTRRGVERTIFILTVLVAGFFLISSVIQTLIF